MVKVCDIIDPVSVAYLSEILAGISSNNETSNILNLRSRGVTKNDIMANERILQDYRSQLTAAIQDASPGSQMIKCIVERSLWIIVPIILLVLGSIGNCTSFAILTRKKLPSYVYLSALAMADQGVLITGLMRHCIDRILGYRLEDSHHWACVFTQLVGSSLSYLSAWLIVVVTAERAFVIMFPFSSIRLYSRSRETLVVIVLSLACFLSASHFFLSVRLKAGQEKRFTIDIEQVQNYSQCQLRSDLYQFSKAWYWIDGLLYSYLPFFLIICLNGLIVSHVRKAKAHRNVLTSRCTTLSSTQIRDSSMHHSQPNTNMAASSRQTVQVTLMLISISVCFLITTCPIVVMKIVSFTQVSIIFICVC